MSELTISSTDWLAISFRNGAAIVFNLKKADQWQYLTPSAPNTQAAAATPAEEDDDNSTDLNRNLIRFTPNGRMLAINGQNKQISIYTSSGNETDNLCWQLKRIINVKKRASAFDLTNELLLIADKSGDVYRFDLSSPSDEPQVTLTAEDCIMGHLSMLLDVAFVRTKDDQPYILTADRDEKIRLSHYPNAYNIQGYCLGHIEFVSHVKLVDTNHILSASGDGTLRLWQLPECVELNQFQSKSLLSSAKRVFYPLSSNIENQEPSEDVSPVDSSIWKLDLVSSSCETFVALSIYTSRAHSVYLTTVSRLTDETRVELQLTFDTHYGAIIDYRFSSTESVSDTQCDLYVLFDSNTLLKVNLIPILANEPIDSAIVNVQEISSVLGRQEFHSVNQLVANETIFKQLFKSRGSPGDCSYFKRKNERIEQQEEQKRNKKQAVSSQFQEKVSMSEKV